MKKILIIGGGIGGCAAGHLLSQNKDFEILLVEKSGFLGAGNRTFFWGGHPYTFGPRHFLTKQKKLYDYMNSIVPLRDCSEHKFLTYVEKDNQFYNMPLSYDDVDKMPDKSQIYRELEKLDKNKESENFEEFWMNSIGNILYNKVVKNYNKKMWMVEDNSIFKSFKWTTKGDPIKKGKRKGHDDGVISAYPYDQNGYNKYFEIASKDIKVMLNTTIEDYDLENKKVKINGESMKFDYIINTIGPDEVFKNIFGELKFIGRDFHKIVLPLETAFPKDVYFLYYANSEAFTRIVEYKRFTRHKSPTTLIGLEIPSMKGKFYPMPIYEEQILAKKYFDIMPENVFSIGRNGTYRYGVDIDDCIEQAMEVEKLINSKIWEGPVPLEKHRSFTFGGVG